MSRRPTGAGDVGRTLRKCPSSVRRRIGPFSARVSRGTGRYRPDRTPVAQGTDRGPANRPRRSPRTVVLRAVRICVAASDPAGPGSGPRVLETLRVHGLRAVVVVRAKPPQYLTGRKFVSVKSNGDSAQRCVVSDIFPGVPVPVMLSQ